MPATVANFGMHAGKKFNTQSEECMDVGINTILPLYLLIHQVQYKYADHKRQNVSRNKIHNLSYGVAAVSTSFI
jgi:hypothetical protein